MSLITSHHLRRSISGQRDSRDNCSMKHQAFYLKLKQNCAVDSNGCWIWQRSMRTDGYGQVRVLGKVMSTHRAMWYAIHDKLFTKASGIQICHTCDVRACLNPEHLWKGTHKENIDDRDRKGRNYWSARTHCNYGHEFTPENTIQGKRQRSCRQCRSIREATQRERKRLADGRAPRRDMLPAKFRETILQYAAKGYSEFAISHRVSASRGQIKRAIERWRKEQTGETIKPLSHSSPVQIGN